MIRKVGLKDAEAIADIYNGYVKKMFGCYCLYCDGQPVGWLSENAFSLREVGLTDLPAEIKRPLPQDKIQEIVLPLDSYQAPWLPKVIQETANRRKK